MGVKNFVNNPSDYNGTCDFIRENFLVPAEKQLKQERDHHRIAQLQGEIKAYERVIDLRNTVNGRG
jgi:hypothetical protein